MLTPSPIPMKRLQAADKVLGWIACTLLQPMRLLRRLRRTSHSGDLLLIKFWGLGSLQLLTPAVRALRMRYPASRLVFLTLVENGEFARGLGVFDEVVTLDVRTASWTEVFRRIVGLARRLRRGRFRAVYDFEFFTRFSAVISWLTKARESHGFAAPSVWRGGLHTHAVPFNRYWHVARNFRCLAGGENGNDTTWRDLTPFPVTDEHERELELCFASCDLGRPEDVRPLAVLNPNAGSLSLERRWPPAHFAELARRLAFEDGMRVVLIGARSEIEWTAEVAARAGELPPATFANLAGRLSLGALHALLARADAFVSNDSGPMHLAAALGTPTVGLFGPETPVMYRPLGPIVKALYEPPACSPCINVHENKVANCYRGRPECLINLTVERVLEETRALAVRATLRVAERVVEAPAPRQVGTR